MSGTGFALPQIQIISIEDILQLPLSLTRKQKYFTLLLAWDLADTNDPRLKEVLQQLLAQGLAYFCVWGCNCEAIHDEVDAVRDTGLSIDVEGHLCMTTWHADEPLDEVFWFFSNLALPSDPHVFADFERFAVAIGNPKWAHSMRELNQQNL